jgi:hypothetical protein
MIGTEILQNLYKLIHQHYVLGIQDFDDQVDLFWTNDQVIDGLQAHAIIIAKPKVYELLDAFRVAKIGSDYLDNQFIPLTNIELIDFSTAGFLKRNRAFSYSDNEFGYLALKKLAKINPLSTIDIDPSAYRTLIDYISTALSNGENAKVTDLLTLIENESELSGILVRKIAEANSPLSIYSYLYYQDLLHGSKIDLDPRLNYSMSHGATATLSNGTKYEQYFEVFDIINELNHAADAITRFLKLYHIIEYLAYRRELVELEDKARNNRTFIREIHSLTGKGDSSNKELEVLKRNFKKIFSVEIAGSLFNIAPLTQPERNFLEKYWGISGFSNTEPGHIATLIYRIRNSIVHNKESEFHITTTNPDEYNDVLGLIKKIIQLLEKRILDKISVDDPLISYQSQYIELY